MSLKKLWKRKVSKKNYGRENFTFLQILLKIYSFSDW